MNASRTFILRPVATTLLMAAIILAGLVAYRELPVSALPTVDYPVYPGEDVLSGGRAGGHGRLSHRAPGATVRPDAGPCKQMTSAPAARLVITLQFGLDLSTST